MATIINNPGPNNNPGPGNNGGDNSGIGFILGIIVAILVVALFLLYGLPALRAKQTAPNSSSTSAQTNINVTLPNPSGYSASGTSPK